MQAIGAGGGESDAPFARSPVAAQSWVDDIRFAPGARGAATTQSAYDANTFLAGEPVRLGMTVKDAPAGTAVKVIWYGPKGRMNAETKHVRAQGERLEFATRETIRIPHRASRRP